MGMISIVGAGPGDPDLLTLRARDLLARADVVLYDSLIPSQVLGHIPDGTLRVFRGKRGRKGSLTQKDINRLLVRWGREGKRVVRLKGGDPFVFGRGAEEALELRRHRIPFELVPGVTSATAVPAYAGIPVTHRALNSAFTVLTGHEDPSKPEARIDWKSLALNEGTLVFLMGLHTLPSVCGRLILEGKDRDTPAAAIQSGTTSRQRTVTGTLGTLPGLVRKAGLRAPATVVVGKVVSLRRELDWWKKGSLAGWRVLLTRTRAQSSVLSSMLEGKGAEVIELPTLEIVPTAVTPQVRGWMARVGSYDWIIFTSANAIRIFMGELYRMGKDVRSLAGVKLACVGSATAAALRAFGIKADLVPGDYKQEGLVRAFRKAPLSGKKVLFTRAREGRDLLLHSLRDRGALVDPWFLYRNRLPKEAKAAAKRIFRDEGGVDLLLFASSSSVDHFFGLFTGKERKKWLASPAIGVIGPVTGSALGKWGRRAAFQPRKYSIPDLVRSLEKWAKGRRKP